MSGVWVDVVSKNGCGDRFMVGMWSITLRLQNKWIKVHPTKTQVSCQAFYHIG